MIKVVSTVENVIFEVLGLWGRKTAGSRKWRRGRPSERTYHSRLSPVPLKAEVKLVFSKVYPHTVGTPLFKWICEWMNNMHGFPERHSCSGRRTNLKDPNLRWPGKLGQVWTFCHEGPWGGHSRGGLWVGNSLTLLRNETLPLLSSQSQGREEVQNKKKTSWKVTEMPNKVWTWMLKKPAGVIAVGWC